MRAAVQDAGAKPVLSFCGHCELGVKLYAGFLDGGIGVRRKVEIDDMTLLIHDVAVAVIDHESDVERAFVATIRSLREVKVGGINREIELVSGFVVTRRIVLLRAWRRVCRSV